MAQLHEVLQHQGCPQLRNGETQVKDEFGRDGEVVDIRGSGVFDVPGDDVYVRYWEKTGAQTALSYLVGRL